jgi:hypothetical protein
MMGLREILAAVDRPGIVFESAGPKETPRYWLTGGDGKVGIHVAVSPGSRGSGFYPTKDAALVLAVAAAPQLAQGVLDAIEALESLVPEGNRLERSESYADRHAKARATLARLREIVK